MKVYFNQEELITGQGIDFSAFKNLCFRAADQIFDGQKSPAAVNVIFVTADYIQNLNKKFRSVDEPTDVMSFPLKDKKTFGEIYICPEEAFFNAADYREPPVRELVRLFVHGSLHLLGFTDYKKDLREKMWRRQEEIVKRVMKLG